MSADTVAGRLEDVRERIASAARRVGRDPASVSLIAVTKTVAVTVIREAVAAGQRDLGENRAQEMLAKRAALGDLESGAEPAWHFLGRLQRNKVKLLADSVKQWHSIDRAGLVDVLGRYAPAASVYVQVNLAAEPQKGGCAPGDTAALVGALTGAGLCVEGLMTIPPAGEEPRPYFARLRDLAGELGLPGLSMGMTGDFETAVEEGATVVRIGSALFGPRPTGADLRR